VDEVNPMNKLDYSLGILDWIFLFIAAFSIQLVLMNVIITVIKATFFEYERNF